MIVNGRTFQSSYFSPILFVKAELQEAPLKKGNIVDFYAKLNRPLGYENRFGFNYAKWAFANGILAKGKVLGQIEVLTHKQHMSQLLLNELYPLLSKYKNNAYFYPLLLAEKSLLTHQQKAQLQSFGLSHLFAISGLHIGVLFLVFCGFFRFALFFWLSPKKLFFISFVSVALVWGYVYLIDFSLPSTRAAILLSLWFCLKHYHWHTTKTWLFGVMTIATLIIQPTGVIDAGWWLSIFAVAGIFIFNHINHLGHASERGVFGETVKVALLFQLYIGLWMFPLSLYWFSGVSISGLWLNVLLVPIFCFIIIPGLFLAAFFILIGLNSLSDILFSQLDNLFTLILELSVYLSQTISWLALPIPLYGVAIALVVTLFLHRLIRQKTKIALFSFIVVLVLVKNVETERGALQTLVFDVGQGTSILLFREGKGILYDLGPVYASGFSATEAVVSPNLIGLGITQLDKVIISHQDSDHYGDISAINAILPNSLMVDCPTTSTIWRNTKLVRIWPDTNPKYTVQLSDNDTSCVLKVVDLLSNRSLLLTGDISREIELRLVERHNRGEINLRADLLFSAHHGSRFSSSYPFLKAVNATDVIHTSGVFNHFGFPTKQVLSRVSQLSAKQYSTSNWGQLVINFNATTREITIKPWLTWLSPFWKKQNPFSFQVEIR